MRIKGKNKCFVNGELRDGVTFDLEDEALARRLVERGWADEVVLETATAPDAPEQATSRRTKKRVARRG